MAKKPLAKISVREITEDSGVNRQTFYYHFEDIYDMVRWMYQEEAIKLIAEHEGVLLWQDGALQLFKYIEENKEVSLCALNSLGHQHLKRFFYDDVYAAIEKTFLLITEGVPNVPQDYGEFLAHYYSISLAALIESWLRGDVKQTPEEIVKYIDIAIHDQIRGGYLRNGKSTE